jgi:hypothetical protein
MAPPSDDETNEPQQLLSCSLGAAPKVIFVGHVSPGSCTRTVGPQVCAALERNARGRGRPRRLTRRNTRKPRGGGAFESAQTCSEPLYVVSGSRSEIVTLVTSGVS